MSDSNLKIRIFQKEDQEQVITLWRNVFKYDPHWNKPDDIIKRKFLVQPEFFLVGICKGNITATVIGGYDGFRGWIYHLAVDPTMQRRGYGRLMMQSIESRLKSAGCPKINIQIRSSNLNVIKFYEEIGYKVEEHTSMGKLLK